MPRSPSAPAPSRLPSRGSAFLWGVHECGSDCLGGSHSVEAAADQRTLSASNDVPLTQTVPRCGKWTPASVPRPPRAGPALPAPGFPLVPLSCRVLCGSTGSSPRVTYSACPQLVFCNHVCVRRCIPDGQMFSTATCFSTFLFLLPIHYVLIDIFHGLLYAKFLRILSYSLIFGQLLITSLIAVKIKIYWLLTFL